MQIREVIVVEGRDDTAAIKRAADAQTIETHGYGIDQETWDRLEAAYREKGLIIFTDPDFAGNQIRQRLSLRFPKAGQAHLTREDAARDDDIGIEYAEPDQIRQALANVHYPSERTRAEQPDRTEPAFTRADLRRHGLEACAGAAEKRRLLGRALGIGYGNSRQFLARLNGYGITRQELQTKLGEIE